VLEQPEARALFVCDQRVHDEWMMKPYVAGVEPIDRFKLAYRRGARCAVAEDLDEFDYLPDEWGYPGPVVRRALKEFNEACEEGRPEPSRVIDAAPIVDPPYYVTELVPAITFTFGGLLIDPRARVLDAHRRPIPGLLAAGADTGGLWVRAYAGGLATALVFGLQASQSALAIGQGDEAAVNDQVRGGHPATLIGGAVDTLSLSGQSTRAHGVHERCVVALGLIRVCDGERADRPVKTIAAA
jgi:FAD binding domain